MHPVLKRIALNGVLAAGILAGIGVAYAQLAGMYLAIHTPVRSVPGVPPTPPPEDPAVAGLVYRIPATMALWGFILVAAGEGFLYLWRGKRTAQAAKPPEPQPDPAAALLEELLRKAEAAPSPSPAPGENSPTPELVPGERGA